MTRQEAIKILNKYDLNFCDIDGNPIPPQDLAEAVYMAVQALEQDLNYEKDIKRENYIENKEVSFKITIPAHDIKIEG